MSRTTLSLTCVLWLTLMGVAVAQPTSNDPGQAQLQSYSGGVSAAGSYFNVNYLSGNGVGYRNGYTQLGSLTPFWLNEDLVLAGNTRLMITDTQQVGANLGGLLRYLNPDNDRIYGINSYYDIDQSLASNHYRQAGVGLESLGQWWDFRANGYFALTDTSHFLGALGVGNDLTYFQHYVGFMGVGAYENAISGGDWEFGTPLTATTPWLRGYAGMYYYDARANSPVGFRGRIEGWVADDLQLGVQVTQDRQFGTNVNASVNFQFSGFRPTRWFPNFTTRERMLIPVQRNWRVATGRFQQADFIPAYNPRTAQPYFIDWVDNSQPIAGNGTYEHPFNFLPPGDPRADLFLVRVGNTSAVAPLSGSIHLTNYQRLLGEGREHQIQAYTVYGNITTPVQTYNLPGFTNTGLYPYLTSAGNTVTLANNNEVSAFNLFNAAGAAITNTPFGTNNFDLNYLNIRGNAGGGIVLTNATGTGLITQVNAINNAAGGISIDSGIAPLFLSLQDVTASGFPQGSQAFGVSVRADMAPILAQFNNVTANGNTTFGIELTETNSGIQAVLNNVTAQDNGAAGLRADGVGGVIDLSLTNVDTSNNLGRGIYVTGNNTSVIFNYTGLIDNGNGDDNINFTLTNFSTLTGGGLHDVNFDNSLTGSGIVLSMDQSQIGTTADPFNIVNVTANGNGQDGLRIVAANGSSAEIHVTNGSFSGNGVDGISTVLSGGSVVNLTVDPTPIDNNLRDGVHFEVQDGSILTAVFTEDTINNNGRSAVFGEVDLLGTGGSLVSLTLLNTPAVRSGADGMFISSNNGATILVDVTNGDFSDSGRTTANSSGVRFDATNSAIALSLIGTPAQNTALFPNGTQAFGLQLNLDNSTFAGTVTDGNFSNNLQYGVLLNAANLSTAALSLTNVPVNGNGLDGFRAIMNSGSDLAFTATNSSFSNNGLVGGNIGSGLSFTAVGTGGPDVHGINAILNNVQVNGNAQFGIVADMSNVSILQLSLTDSFVDNNGLEGVGILANNSTLQATFATTSVSNNGGTGVKFTAAGAPPFNSTIDFTDSFVDGNGLSGFSFDVSAGHRLDLTATNTSFSNNVLGQGIDGRADGAGTAVTINPFLFVTGDNNGAEGLRLLIDNSAFLNANINGGSFSNNGQNAAADGVHVMVDHNGFALICFDGTTVDNNSDDGFDFSVFNGGTLYVALQTSGQYGTLSASGNANQPVRFTVGPGASGALFLDGPNQFNGNGSANGFTFVANNAAQAAFSFSGTADGNAEDGINVQMTNVGEAYIDIHDGSASNNGQSGIDISLNNVTFGSTPLTVSFFQGDFTANPFRIQNMILDGNGEEGIKIVGVDVTMPVGVIYGNSVSGNGTNGVFDGILIDMSGNSILADFSIGNNAVTGSANDINSNTGNGINVQLHDNSQMLLNIQGNNVIGNSLNNIRVNLPDNTIASLHIDNNNVDGNGVVGNIGFNVGLNFSGGNFSLFNSGEPPDTMGAVGPTAVVELINDQFSVYDKTTGAQLFVSSDEAFWQAAGASFLGQDTFDHRIIYDPTVDRWFATAITRGINGVNDSILIAVSNDSNPLNGFQSVQFIGENGLFSDFDALGINGDAITIATNNFTGAGVFQDISVFSIPKADLISGAPSLANMTRFQNLASGTVGVTLQPVVNFGPTGGHEAILSGDYYTNPNGRLVQTNVMGGAGSGATLSASTTITGVPNFTFAPNATEPGGGTIDSGGDRISSNVVEVNGHMWAAHAVQGTSGTSAVRWYEIDEATGAVVQTGLIEAPGVDYFFPSIAVNATGEVVIGMSGSSASQSVSSFAVFGTTTAGVTTFQAPTLLQAGFGSYQGNRWGDYSATVVDPSDPNTFWTFQEIATGDFNYQTQITQITSSNIPAIIGNTVNDGIQVNVLNNAQLLNSTINANTSISNGANGIHVTLRDNALINTLNIDGNTTTSNGLNGILVETPAGAPTITNLLTVNGPGDASSNGASGINVQFNNVLGTPSVSIDGTQVNGGPGRTVNDNGAAGINFIANNTPLNIVTIANNTVDPNQGDGIHAFFTNSQTDTVNISGNRINANVGDGINLSYLNSTSVNTTNILANLVTNNAGEGINLTATNTALSTLNVNQNEIALNTNNGFNLALDNAPITTLNIQSNLIGLTSGGIGNFVDDSLPVIRTGFNGNTLARNDDGSTGSIPIGFTLDFFGQLFPNLFVNNNGNVTFNNPLGTFTPFPIVNNGIPMMAPFFADVDTRSDGQPVTYGTGVIAGHQAFGVNWVDVDYFSGSHANQHNSFQLILIDRSDVAAGDFDFEFNYGQITWETGNASGGTNGLGGNSARVGFTNGTTQSLEFAGSAVNGALLDTGPAATSLIQNDLNSTHLGRYIFAARNGGIGGGGPNGGDGIHITQVNGSDIGTTLFDSNTISNNGVHGVDYAVVNNSNIGPTTFNNNTISSNGLDGVHLVDPNTVNKILNFTFTDNTISSNGQAAGAQPGNGINFQISNGEALTLRMTGNTVEDNINSGARVVLSGTSSLAATIGDTAANPNTFTGNGDAGMSVVLSDNATGAITVANSSFNNSVVSTGGTFIGDGLGIALRNNASLSTLHVGDAAVQNTFFNGNAGHGFDLQMTGTSSIGGQMQLLNTQANENGGDGIHITLTDAANINDLLVTGTAAGSSFNTNAGNGFFVSTNSSAVLNNVDLESVTASGNTGDGIQFLRQGNSIIGSGTVNNSTATGNTGNGIQITAADRDTPPTDTYSLTNNTITGNTANGILLNLIGDADLNVTVSGSTISTNGANGILTTTNSDVTDSPTLVLNVNTSTINGNADNGILILSPHLVTIDSNTINNNGLDGIDIGVSRFSNTFDEITNNTINGNQDGIFINGATVFANITGNTISQNTDDGIVADANGGGSQLILNIDSNLITFNGGDGIQISARNGSGTLANPNQFNITNNVITDSGRRGILVVNAGGTNGFGGTGLQRTIQDLTISNNTISRSGLEGIYIVNTASNTQATTDNINNLASQALFADGSVFSKPILNLTIDNNLIDSNGQTHAAGNFIGATGIVVNVGTSDGTTSFTDNGGFASNGRGGIVASITNNNFSGQFGSDVTFRPFISTVPPATTNGAINAADWTDQNETPRDDTNNEFIVNSYQQDPLARLDLTFTNNHGDGFFATNPRASTAFYNNDESVFKSRTISQDGNDPPNGAGQDDDGPFNVGTRARNATREASRAAPFNHPLLTIIGSTGQNSNSFLYPGVSGNSTFRVQNGPAFANPGGAGGNTFTNDFSDFSTVVPIGGDIGELPFVWGTF